MTAKCFSLSAAVALVAATACAFDLGRRDAVVYAAPGHESTAGELSGYLGKVFGKSFPVKKMPEDVAPDLAGIFVGRGPAGCD